MRSVRSRPSAFTIVEVMMASVLLVVAFMGMISAITVGSEMLATTQRQDLAAQVIQHEFEQLRLQSWTAINALPNSTTTLGVAWTDGTAYAVGDTATYSGGWYRCTSAHTSSSSILPTSTSYWKIDTPPYASAMTTAGKALGTTFTLTRTTSDVTTDLVEVTLTLTWNKSGTTTAANAPSGSWLSRLTFFNSSPISRTYTRTATGYFGKYGLANSYQRS